MFGRNSIRKTCFNNVNVGCTSLEGCCFVLRAIVDFPEKNMQRDGHEELSSDFQHQVFQQH